MSFVVTYSNLEKDAAQWKSNIDPSVNKALSLGFMASNIPDGRLKVTNVGNCAFAGGLVSRKCQVPQFNGAASTTTYPAYAQLSTNITIPSTSLYNLARLETDFIVVFSGAPNPSATIPNKANGSTQLNFDTGTFNVDASPGVAQWSDIGAGPGKGNVTPDVEHPLVIKYAYDLVNQKVSTLSISWDGVVYPIPASLQGVSFQPSNWAVTASIQKQNEMYAPGATEVIYRGTTLQWSDQSF